MVIMAAADEAELVHMVATAVASTTARSPSAIRAARASGVELPEVGPFRWKSARVAILREGSRVALLSLGTRLAECLKAADELAARGLSTTVADARFAKPLDTELVERLAREHEVLITVEEGSVGGFGSFVMQHLAEAGCAGRAACACARWCCRTSGIDHDKPERMYAAPVSTPRPSWPR